SRSACPGSLPADLIRGWPPVRRTRTCAERARRCPFLPGPARGTAHASVGLPSTGRHMPDALNLLRTRRSVKPVELAGPALSREEVETLLTIASRVPDHGKLVPWRFIVFDGDARLAAGEAIVAAFRRKFPEANPEQVDYERKRLARAPLVVAVVSRA